MQMSSLVPRLILRLGRPGDKASTSMCTQKLARVIVMNIITLPMGGGDLFLFSPGS